MLKQLGGSEERYTVTVSLSAQLTDQQLKPVFVKSFIATDKPPFYNPQGQKTLRKLMRGTISKEVPKPNTDQIAIAVIDNLVDKILGIAKMTTGTGQPQASAIYQLLTLWKVIPHVIGMCFDTTASNTKPANGAHNSRKICCILHDYHW